MQRSREANGNRAATTRRNVLIQLWLTLLLIGTIALAAVAQSGQPTTPKAGTAERKAIMDALRVPVEKQLKQKVIFQVDHLKVLKGWAHLRGRPLKPDGKPIDYRKTEWQEAIDEGAFDDGVYALLRKQKGKWKVVTFNIGATDVVWDGWDKEHGAPPAIFK
jgi:hypothetical protein